MSGETTEPGAGNGAPDAVLGAGNGAPGGGVLPVPGAPETRVGMATDAEAPAVPAEAPAVPAVPAVAPAVPDLPVTIELLHDVELKVEVVLGRARLPLRDLLSLRPGSTIELDRTRNSPVDVLVNGTLFARGDIVVIDDAELGVQIETVVGAEVARPGRSA